MPGRISPFNFWFPKARHRFVMMPSLFQVETGTFDLDDFSVKVIDATDLKAKAEVAAAEKARKLAEAAEKRQAQAAQTLSSEDSLLTNGNFESDSKGVGFADHWGAAKNGISGNKREGTISSLRFADPRRDGYGCIAPSTSRREPRRSR